MGELGLPDGARSRDRRACGQRCRHNGWSRVVAPSSDAPCPTCHPDSAAPGTNHLPLHPLPPDAATTVTPGLGTCGVCGDPDNLLDLDTCVVCGDYVEAPDPVTGGIDGEKWPTMERDHWIHSDCLRETWDPEDEPSAQGASGEVSPTAGATAVAASRKARPRQG